MLGRNSIRVEQARICLRALTGNLKIGGGEVIVGPGPLIDGKMGVRDSMLTLPEMISPEQRKKQIGSDRFKLMGWPGYEAMAHVPRGDLRRARSRRRRTTSSRVQPLIWKAILETDPYPITAMITWGSNVLLNGGDVKTMYKAAKSPNLELHVVMEHFLTPTAMLADYVLPIASKLEKPMCATHEDFAPNIACSEAAVEPLGERHGDFLVWKGLAERLGFGEYFPWKTEEELADYRLAPLGLTFKEVATEKYFVRSDEPWTYETINPRTGKKTGFATPSGKVELYSNVWRSSGTTRCPSTRSPRRAPSARLRWRRSIRTSSSPAATSGPCSTPRTGSSGIGTREQYPDPIMDIHPETAAALGIAEGDWVLRGDPPGCHQAAGHAHRRDRPPGGQRPEPLVVPRAAAAGALAGRPLGVELQRAHHRRRPRYLRPDHRRVAAAGVALQDLEGGDGGRARAQGRKLKIRADKHATGRPASSGRDSRGAAPFSYRPRREREVGLPPDAA